MQSVTKLSDFELVDLSKSGNQAAFKEIITRHKSMVATVAMNMVGDYHDATEVGQEVFIRLHRSLPQFRKDAKLATYLTRITMNLSINVLKRRQNFAKRSLDLSKASHRITTGSDDFESKEIIAQALKRLDDKHRSVVVIRMIQGFSTQETADILEVPKGTVLSRLKRGMEKLKLILEKDLNYQHE